MLSDTSHMQAQSINDGLLEVIGIYTSILNRCDYCIEHHYAGITRLLNDDTRSKAIQAALEAGDWVTVFVPKEAAAPEYVRKLTVSSAETSDTEIRSLRSSGR